MDKWIRIEDDTVEKKNLTILNSCHARVIVSVLKKRGEYKPEQNALDKIIRFQLKQQKVLRFEEEKVKEKQCRHDDALCNSVT